MSGEILEVSPDTLNKQQKTFNYERYLNILQYNKTNKEQVALHDTLKEVLIEEYSVQNKNLDDNQMKQKVKSILKNNLTKQKLLAENYVVGDDQLQDTTNRLVGSIKLFDKELSDSNNREIKEDFLFIANALSNDLRNINDNQSKNQKESITSSDQTISQKEPLSNETSPFLDGLTIEKNDKYATALRNAINQFYLTYRDQTTSLNQDMINRMTRIFIYRLKESVKNTFITIDVEFSKNTMNSVLSVVTEMIRTNSFTKDTSSSSTQEDRQSAFNQIVEYVKQELKQ